MSDERIRVDLGDLTLGELAELGEMMAPTPLAEVLDGPKQAAAIAAIVAIVRRRTDPDFTIEQALALKMSEIEMVAPAPEASSGAAGVTPLSSAEPGGSIRSA
jgi:hypothetical protein